ncbi:hypothetical protein L6452_34865 [Arctium lappa]|uniref:Uncharacterized protein n=1 Tax=Arctium lappa TaxID=4217 RepID=A0ACB8YKX5_ARCLA|nr:hypothetical protein L6452_34865 [Arctium lappa]
MWGGVELRSGGDDGEFDEEKEITDRVMRLEQQVVAPPMVALARKGGREWDGEDGGEGGGDIDDGSNGEP